MSYSAEAKIYFVVLITWLLIPSAILSQDKYEFGGSVGGILWRADWHSESSMETFNTITIYDINPSILRGYSATLSYKKNDSYYGNWLLEYVEGEFDDHVKQSVFEGDDRNYKLYKRFKSLILQRISKGRYIVLRSIYGIYSGNITLEGLWENYGLTSGTRQNIKSKWLRLDALFLFYSGSMELFKFNTDFFGKKKTYSIWNEFYVGGGYRYINYNKPEVFYHFYGHENKDSESDFGEIVVDELIEVKLENAVTTGHHLVIGLWHPSYMGLPSVYPWFVDFLFYIGQANIKSDNYKLKDKIGLGLQLNLGISLFTKLFQNYHLSFRLGYQYHKHMMTVADEVHKEDDRQIYLGVNAHESWSGPFLGLILSF